MKMKSMTLSFVAATLLTGFGVLPAMAQSTFTPGIDRQQQEIRAQIQQGVASGRITQQEAQELYKRERDIQFREIRIKNDGRATEQERDSLRRDLDAMRADVDRKLNNNRVAGRPGDNTPGIDNREADIHARIENGIASGRITRTEAKRLHQRERDIQRREAKFKSDHRINPVERDKLHRDLDKLSQDVDRLLNNERRTMHR
jgi:septal ring factor EnvC (AmiA/AmiB activator)